VGHPVRLVVDDDLRRARLTVLFRLVLLVPQLLWGLVWWFVVGATVPFAWLLALFAGRVWPEVHALNARFLRWYTHVTAYAHLLAEPYPRFDGRPGYPIDVDVAPPERQPRLVTAFRLVLALPALVLLSALGAVLQIVAVLAWFACLALGRMPRGMRDLGAYIVHFTVQTLAYVTLLTPRYPSMTYEPIVKVPGTVLETASLSLEDGQAGGSGRP
jgi:hypothetical protein